MMNSVDIHPLIGYSIGDELLQSRRLMRHGPPPLRGAMRLFRRASGRRMRLRDPSVRVRENAAEELEERQSFWFHSKPAIILDLLWNLVFVIVGFTVLGLSVEEKPLVPMRIWVVGYILLCVVHVGCVVAEYRRRREAGWGSGGSESLMSGSHVGGYGGEHGVADDTSVTKNLESANSMFSFIWWVIGFYWVLNGGQTLLSGSPRLYWLCVSFLVFDVAFIIVCVAASCLVGIAVCCFLPCIIAILYAVTDQDGATDEEIDRLPKFKFRRVGNSEKVNGEVQASEGFMTECDTNAPTDHPISQADAECCVCLSVYENGAELRQLPCQHHFHCTCIDKWLHINATCPMCKFNILKPRGRHEIGQDGATDEEIHRLPKFKFRRVRNSEKVNGQVQAFEGFMTECDTNAPTEHPISQADAECCICLSVYENGAELRQLPCQHHFHCTCIDKWLHINATCPMCKFNILKPRDRHEIGLV